MYKRQALVGLPFAWLDSYIAGALFFGLSAALLATMGDGASYNAVDQGLSLIHI